MRMARLLLILLFCAMIPGIALADSIGGVSIGDDDKKAFQVFGEPNAGFKSGGAKKLYLGRNKRPRPYSVSIGTFDEKVTSIDCYTGISNQVEHPETRTSLGVCLGSSLEKVSQAYGVAKKIKRFPDGNEEEYEFRTGPKETLTIRITGLKSKPLVRSMALSSIKK
jgi:hypothetical protein